MGVSVTWYDLSHGSKTPPYLISRPVCAHHISSAGQLVLLCQLDEFSHEERKAFLVSNMSPIVFSCEPLFVLALFVEVLGGPEGLPHPPRAFLQAWLESACS